MCVGVCVLAHMHMYAWCGVIVYVHVGASGCRKEKLSSEFLAIKKCEDRTNFLTCSLYFTSFMFFPLSVAEKRILK